MKILTLFLNEQISRNKIFSKISNLVSSDNKIKKKIVNGLIARENEITTGLGDKVAIPHFAVDELSEPILVFIKNKVGIDWNSLDGEKVNLVFCILTSKTNPESHLKIISSISKILLNEDLKEKLFIANTQIEVEKILNSIQSPDNISSVALNKNYDIVAVTACPSGLAHTFLAKDALINEAIKRNLNIKVETHGATGVENKLTKAEIQNAKKLILAVDKELDLGEEYNLNQNIYKTRTIDVVKNPSKCFEDVKTKISKSIYNSFYKSYNSAGSYLFLSIKILGFILGILYLLTNKIPNSNELFFFNWSDYISIIAKCVLFLFASFIAYNLSQKNESLIFSFMTIAMFGIADNLTIRSVSLIEILLVSILWGFLPKLIDKIQAYFKSEYLFLKSLLKFILYLLSVVLFIIIRVFLVKYFDYLNKETLSWIIMISNKYWWFNSLVVFILANCYIFDFGKDLNKWTMITCYLLQVISMSFDVNNLWAYPFTVILFAPAIPNFNASLAILIRKNKYSKETLNQAKKTFKDGFRPITETTIPLYKIFKNKLLIANFCSVLIGSILIGIFKLRFFGGISSPLGFIFGYVDQPYWFYGLSWILMYLSSITLGVTTLTILSLFERKNKNVIR